MEIARERQEISLDLSRGSCVTIGNFDGVHKGHQKLINRAIQKAKARNMTSVVVSFCPHPLKVLVGPNVAPFITVREQKLDILESLGVDLTLLLNFTKEMAALSPEEFVATYLADWLNTKELIVGYDYSFGKGRKGNFELLSSLGDKHGYQAERLDPVIIDSAIVSSTRIRDLIQAGDVWPVKALMGRFYVVRGSVVHGRNRGGRLLGFPTANLKLQNEVYPKKGVYAIWVQLEHRFLPAVANIGVNPTFGNEDLSVEAHILDFDEDIYGHEMRVHFVQRLRDEKKFSGIEELTARIREDVALGRRILESPEAQIENPLLPNTP
ncbi:MAG: bifunctional riboflavin kinase/FAD synthetase [Desulfovibrio sp.]|nr:MAG: bifunctional riboflavin kinase/FAD synthetase [Desulfovibrio sp.]